MNLRLDYSGLTLDAQVQIARAAWENELPRPLIFDNCEDEALPGLSASDGGSRVLVSSRREQWDAQPERSDQWPWYAVRHRQRSVVA